MLETSFCLDTLVFMVEARKAFFYFIILCEYNKVNIVMQQHSPCIEKHT